MSRLTGSIMSGQFDFGLPLEPYAYNPAQAKRLLAEAGFPKGGHDPAAQMRVAAALTLTLRVLLGLQGRFISRQLRIIRKN